MSPKWTVRALFAVFIIKKSAQASHPSRIETIEFV